jgi:hypothetical protein
MQSHLPAYTEDQGALMAEALAVHDTLLRALAATAGSGPADLVAQPLTEDERLFLTLQGRQRTFGLEDGLGLTAQFVAQRSGQRLTAVVAFLLDQQATLDRDEGPLPPDELARRRAWRQDWASRFLANGGEDGGG